MTSWFAPGSTAVKPLDRLIQSWPSLEQLYTECDLIAQLKAFNSKLLEYITNTPDLVRQAIDFVIQPPRDNDSNERKFKWPLLSVEIVETEALCVVNGFFKECLSMPQHKTNLEHLFSLLDQKSPLLLISAGYFFRIVNCLLNLKFKQLTEWVYSRPETFRRLLQHSNIVTITNTIQILLSLDASKVTTSIQQRKNLKVQTVWLVIGRMRQEQNDPIGESMQNLTNILVEIVEKYYLISDGKAMLEPILASASIQLFVDMAMSPVPFIALPTITLLISLVNYYSFSNLNNEDKENQGKNVEKMDSQPMIQVFCRNFQRFVQMLDNMQKFTLTGYKILELLCHSVSLCSNNILNIIKRTKFLELLLEMLFRHENCNIAHTLIERTFLHIFVNQKKFYDGYKFYIFCGMNIITRTAGKIVNQKFQNLKSRGFFGHLLRIIKIYSSIQTTNEQIIQMIRDNSELWARVTRQIIKPHEEIEFKQLGSYDLNITLTPIEHKVKQTSAVMLPHPKPKTQVLQSLNDQYSQWSKTHTPTTHDSIMNDKDGLFGKPMDEITSANHLFDKTKTGNKGYNSPISKKLQEQLQHQRANSPRNQSYQEFMQKKKMEAQETIKLQRTLSQEKNRSQAARSPSPRQKPNSWVDEEDESKGKKAISKSMIMTNQQKSVKSPPKIRVQMLQQPPLEKKFRKIDERDTQLLSFLGFSVANSAR